LLAECALDFFIFNYFLSFHEMSLVTLEGEMSVRPQKVYPISMKFGMYITVDE